MLVVFTDIVRKVKLLKQDKNSFVILRLQWIILSSVIIPENLIVFLLFSEFDTVNPA